MPTPSTTPTPTRRARVRQLALGTVVGAGLAIGGLGVTGIAGAAIPAADGTITACRNGKGVLKVINAEAGKKCPKGHKKLTWQSGAASAATGLDDAHWVTQATPSDKTIYKGLTVSCPVGEKAIAGGAQTLKAGIVAPQPAEAFLRSSTGSAGSWSASARNFGSINDSWYLRVRVLCAPAG